MNGRKVYRDYAKSRGMEAAGFIEIESGYGYNVLKTVDNQGKEEKLFINFEDVLIWVFKNR